jgi:hypothetical protein
VRDRGTRLALLLATSLWLALPTEAQEEIAPAPLEIPVQPAPTHATALESYLERPGILLVRRHHPLPPLELQGGGQMRLEAVAAHEPGMQHQRVMGIRIELDAPGLAAEERILYIDMHEIEELVRAIAFIGSATGGEELAREGDRTEMSISTRDGLELGVVFAAREATAFLGTPSARFAVPRAAFETLRADLNQARERLFSE